MKPMLKTVLFLTAVLSCLVLSASVFADEPVRQILLDSGTALLDGEAVPEYDYVWHADPSSVHKEVKNAPAEYYTGTKPTGEDDVYIAHDIFFFPEVPAEGFKNVRYDGENEWVYYYPVEEYRDFIWANLPIRGSGVPEYMMHSEEEAYANPVLHITKAGTYEISGTWQGQILIDLGDTDDTFADATAKVTLILNGADVTCSVAPALIFYSVYEADNTWEDRDSYSSEVDISDAGAKVILADDSVNNFSGTNVFRMLKAQYKNPDSNEAVKVQKKMRKTDGAFYSYVSMLIDGQEKGTGVLNIVSGYEGLNSELHLTVNGGKVTVQSQDDGINVNEDEVSVLTVNGGELHIVAGLGQEGDGVDSNGYLVINGGVVISAAKPQSDSGLDSDKGSYVNGGFVVATGSTMDWAETDSRQVTMNLQFASGQASDEAIIVTDTDGKVIFAYDPDKDETAGANNRGYLGAVISCPEFRIGETYYVYVGGDVEGNETDGLYDISTVTGFSGAVRQVYTGTDIGRFGFGGFRRGGGMQNGGDEFPGGDRNRDERPPFGEPREMPEPSEGFPGGQQRPEGPDGGMPGGPMEALENIEGLKVNEDGSFSVSPEAAEAILAILKERDPDTSVTAEDLTAHTDIRGVFDLFTPPDGGMGPDPRTEEEAGGPSARFFMNDTVNAFSGVTDEEAQ